MCCGIISSAKHQRDEIMIKVTLTNDILKKISVIDVNRYFNNTTPEDLLNLLTF